mmetsp:Transcript_30391/g.100582  ORF Transcript_30391/g.100582 Transcript_30391/m.100582 type:complete len:456 (-) Transcript_30391:12-1379(-)
MVSQRVGGTMRAGVVSERELVEAPDGLELERGDGERRLGLVVGELGVARPRGRRLRWPRGLGDGRGRRAALLRRRAAGPAEDRGPRVEDALGRHEGRARAVRELDGQRPRHVAELGPVLEAQRRLRAREPRRRRLAQLPELGVERLDVGDGRVRGQGDEDRAAVVRERLLQPRAVLLGHQDAGDRRRPLAAAHGEDLGPAPVVGDDGGDGAALRELVDLLREGARGVAVRQRDEEVRRPLLRRRRGRVLLLLAARVRALGLGGLVAQHAGHGPLPGQEAGERGRDARHEPRERLRFDDAQPRRLLGQQVHDVEVEVGPARVARVAAERDVLARLHGVADLEQAPVGPQVVVPRVGAVVVAHGDEVRPRREVRLGAAAAEVLHDRGDDAAADRVHGRAHRELEVEAVAERAPVRARAVDALDAAPVAAHEPPGRLRGTAGRGDAARGASAPGRTTP